MKLEVSVSIDDDVYAQYDLGQAGSRVGEGRPRREFILECARIASAPDLFREMSATFDFPAYFGHNWDALNECFSDFFVLESGGLGSEFGDRAGLAVNEVSLILRDAEGLLANGEAVLASLVRVLRYTVVANRDRHSADLHVAFQLSAGSDGQQTARFNRVVSANLPTV